MTLSITGPTRLQINADSPVFTPQQYYLIGYAQDSWRATDRLTLELGLRYDFYSVVNEKNDNAKPFFIEENEFSSDPKNFYDADKNNFSPRLSAAYRIDEKTVFRTGFGLFYGPGQFEDRIQPIENAINRIRVNSGDVPNNGLAYPVTVTRDFLQIRGYTHHRPDEYNMQYGASVSRELPGQLNLTVGYTGSKGKDMFIRGVANTINPALATRLVPTYGEVDYKTSGCLDGAVISGNVDQWLRASELQRASAQCHATIPVRLDRRASVSIFEEQRDDTGFQRGGDGTEHIRLRDRIRHQSAGYSAYCSTVRSCI